MRPRKQTFDRQTIRYYQALKKLAHFFSRHLFLIVTTIAVFNYIYLPFSGWNGRYLGGDCYMRALRVMHWLINPSFFEQPVLESNYPFGEILHWTRPMDLIWLFISLPFWRLGFGIKDTIFISGAFVAPCLGILSVMALAYGLRRQFNIWLTIIGCLIFMLNPVINSFFHPNYPDHHALIIFLMTYALSSVLCWLKKRQNRYLRFLGLCLALLVLVSIEGFFAYGLFLSYYLYLFVFKNISLLPALKTAKYFAIMLMLFWFLDPPYEGWFYVDTGRLSISYVVLAWFIFISLWFIHRGRPHTSKLKLLSLMCAAAGTFLSLILIFGVKILKSPIDPSIVQSLIVPNIEHKPFYVYSFAVIAIRWLFAFIALIVNLFMLKVKAYRRVMLLNLILGVPYFLLSLYRTRVVNYIGLYSILPFLAMLDMLYKNSAYAKDKNLAFPSYLWGIVFTIFLSEYMVQLLPYIYEDNLKKAPSAFSPMTCQKVRNIGGTLVTNIFRSPQYVFECGVNTVGTCYHRNIEGITDTEKLMQATNNREIFPLFFKHQITQILVFRYDETVRIYDKDTLFYKLINGVDVPPFLEEIPIDLSIARLYKVKI